MNSEIIRHRWPDLYKGLSRTWPDGESAPCLSSTPDPALVIDNIFLESGHDKEREAAIQAGLIPPDASTAWIYGLGTGKLAARLLERPALRELNIVLLNKTIAAHILRTIPLPFLKDPRVNLIDGSGQTQVHAPFAALPGCLRLADGECARIRDLVLLELATPFINRQHGEDSRGQMVKRLGENRHFAEKDHQVTELFGREPGRHVLVAAAGPTLELTMETLRSLAGENILICVDAALNALVKARILPDYTVTIDPHPAIRTFFDTDLTWAGNHSLVYFPSVDPEVIKAWPGPRFVAWSRFLADLAPFPVPPGSRLFSAGSVIHPAVDLAVRMGAATITLFGADFSHPHGRTHVTGCAQARNFSRPHAPHTVVNGHGQKVETTPNLMGYLRDLEAYIEKKGSTITWQNASRDGALIQGCSLLGPDAPDRMPQA